MALYIIDWPQHLYCLYVIQSKLTDMKDPENAHQTQWLDTIFGMIKNHKMKYM